MYIIKIASLRTLSLSTFLRQFYCLIFFPLCMCHSFMLLCMSHNLFFSWKLDILDIIKILHSNLNCSDEELLVLLFCCLFSIGWTNPAKSIAAMYNVLHPNSDSLPLFLFWVSGYLRVTPGSASYLLVKVSALACFVNKIFIIYHWISAYSCYHMSESVFPSHSARV